MNQRFIGEMLFFLLLPLAWGEAFPLEITEIMYHPSSEQGGNYNEWIEIYNSGNKTLDLTGWKINGKEVDDINITSQEYLVIVEKIFGNKSFEATYGNNDGVWNEEDGNFSVVSSKSFSLDDNVGQINFSNESVSVIVDYDKSLGANGNNKSLERNKKGEWKESFSWGGTPGKKNSVDDFSYSFSALRITEIMPDSFGDDAALKPQGEWVEIYNSGSEPLSLGGMYLFDANDANELAIADVNTINGTILCGKCYTVVYKDGDSDFALSNDGEDQVRLFAGYPASKNALIDKVSFAQSIEGMSWGKFGADWFRTSPTPGSENIYTGGCDWELSLETNNSIFVRNSTEFTVKVQRIYGVAEPITVRGVVEDYFGKVVKEYSPWKNKMITTTGSTHYSPNLAEGVYQLRFWFENLSCQEDNFQNNNVTKLLAINPQYRQAESSVEIEKIYLGSDDKTKWGNQFTVKVSIYKGDETKQAVQLWAEKSGEKVSKTTSMNILENYQSYPLTLPLQLEPNCNNEISDGSADLIVEAFDLRAEQKFTIEGVDKEVCKDYLKYIKEEEKKAKKIETEPALQILDLPPSVVPGEILRVKVQLQNADEQSHSYRLWTYLFKGKTCYSCSDSTLGRNYTLQSVTLQPGELKIIDFLLKVDSPAKEGEYSLRVRYKKDQQKTEKELAQSIYISLPSSLNFSPNSFFLQQANASLFSLAEEDGEERVEPSLLSPTKKKIINETKGIVIYENSSQKAEKLTPFVIVISLLLMGLVLVRDKWKKTD